MLAQQSLIRVLAARLLPQANPDSQNIDIAGRGGRYGEVGMLSFVRKAHVLADEGSYGILNSVQTAVTGQTTTAFDATKPSLLLFNSDAVGGKRLYLDYIHLINGGTAYSNATSNTAMLWSVAVDTGNRLSSAGTTLTQANPNNDLAATVQPVTGTAGAIVTTTATALKTIVGQRLMRAPVSATALTLANVDEFHFNFGGVEAAFASPIQASATLEATMVNKTFAGPPVVIGPQQSLLFNIACVAGGAVTAGNFVYEVGFWMR